ncbi:MAG: SPFH domain-containing protein [Methylobacter sp.]|jgi:flotillin
MLDSLLTYALPAVIAVAVVVVLFVIVRSVLKMYIPVPPNKALIVYGRRGSRMVTAGGTIVLPVVEKTAELSLDIMTIEVTGDEVKTVTGFPIYVDWTAQIRIPSDEESIQTAAQVFLGKGQEIIQQKAKLTLGGNLREVISKLTVEQVHTDRDAFIGNVQTIIADEMKQMGLFVVSLTIQDVTDKEGYFEALAAKRLAEVKKDAQVAMADADRESREKTADARLKGRQAELQAEGQQAEAEKDLDLRKAEYRQLTGTRMAEADAAVLLRQNQLAQNVATEEGQIEVARQMKQIEVQEQMAALAEKRLETDVKKPADAEAYKIKIQAGAAREKLEIEASAQATASKSQSEALTTRGQADAKVIELKAAADASAVKVAGLAQAEVTRANGLAEADAEKQKLLAQAEGQAKLAEALSAQGEINLRMAAIEKLLAAQVEMTRAWAEPMAQIGSNIKLVQITGGSEGASQGNPIFGAMAQLPELLTKLNAQSEALTGKGLNDLLAQAFSLVQNSDVEPKSSVQESTDQA